MSQAKVDKYKEEKLNRQKIMKKEKRMHHLEMSAFAIVGVLVIGWIGFSIYGKAVESSGTKDAVVFDAGPVQDYLADLTAE